MGLRDMLKKKNELDDQGPAGEDAIRDLSGPQFTFIRSDTHCQDIIHPPQTPPSPMDGTHLTATEPRKQRRSLDIFHSNRSRSASASSATSLRSLGGGGKKDGRRISQRLHLSRQPESSENVPENLPEIVVPSGDDPQDRDGAESQWEKRATILAGQNERARSRPSSPIPSVDARMAQMTVRDHNQQGRSPSPAEKGVVSSKAIDSDIQEAIRLHEEGDLERSTKIFAYLADPNGANNPLSQVLYGLALRHGWGCAPSPEAAVKYLSAAASNAASVEQLALQAGLKKGGAAKGELVLAIFELANCFRHGWGIEKDAIAAKQYYETAANLGDTDAMNEVAWCYLEGYGCKKDKFTAARYYRLAEKGGNKTLGNTWIWKEKYDPPGQGSKK